MAILAQFISSIAFFTSSGRRFTPRLASSMKWVVDESKYKINEGGLATVGPGVTPNCQLADSPGTYHNGACSFAFGDGYSEIRKWKDPWTCLTVAATRIPIQAGNRCLGVLPEMYPNALPGDCREYRHARGLERGVMVAGYRGAVPPESNDLTARRTLTSSASRPRISLFSLRGASISQAPREGSKAWGDRAYCA